MQVIRTVFLPESDYEIVHPDIDEKSFRSIDPVALTTMLAVRKCGAVRKKVPGPALIVASDQVIFCNDEIFEKPADEDEARRFLRAYRTYPATSVAAVCVLNTEAGESGSAKIGVQETTVWFKDSALTEIAIDALIAEGTIMNCAGAIAIGHEDFQERFVLRLAGERETVMGLPMQLTTELMMYALEEDP